MKIIESKIIPLPIKDIDTDMIIPAEFLSRTTKEGFGEFVFDRLRKMDADFPFNHPEYQGAEVLVARENFGCGSSREHAAWALNDWGIKVVIAPSFADIFFNNAQKNGILPVIVETETVEMLFNKTKEMDYRVTVDLENQTVKMPEIGEIQFEIDPYRKECLINGMDDMDYLLSHMDEIKKFDEKHRKNLFFNVDLA